MFLIRLELSLQPTVPWPPLKTSSICPNSKKHMFSWASIFVPHIESEGQTVQTVRTTVIVVWTLMSVVQTYRLCTVPAWTMESAVITHSVKVGRFWRQYKLLKQSPSFNSSTGITTIVEFMKNFSETRPFFVRSALFVIMRATLSFRAISVNPVQWQNFELANLRKPDKMFE